METMKKEWGKPLTGIQEFVPSEFCAPCGDGATEVTYYFMCDGGIKSGTYDVWLDNNPRNGVLDGNWVTNPYTGRYQWSSVGDTWITNPPRPNAIRYYHPCDITHTVTVPEGTSVDNIFPYGFIQLKSTNADGYNTGQVIPVRIWRGDEGNEIHCTTHLDSSSFTPHNPS